MRIKILLLMGLFLLVACGGNGELETAVTHSDVTLDPAVALQAKLQSTIVAQQGDRGEKIATWLAELEIAESKWEANPLQNYEMDIPYINSDKGIIQIHTITVEDGELVTNDVRCSAQLPNCSFAEVDDAVLTIPGLFGMARSSLVNDQVNENSGGFKFHEEYGFPQFIGLKAAGAFPWYWQVESFSASE